MNDVYFVTDVLILLEEAIFPQGMAPRERRFVIYLDKCSIHTSRVSTDWFEKHDIVHMPQPPYSLELALCDFYFFPAIKQKLERIQLADENQSFESLQAILSRLNHKVSNAVFLAWVGRVQEMSENNGGYVG
jgi:hypothetical protein